MSHDRYGERIEDKHTPKCGRPGCNGWNGVDKDDDYRPIPCYVCRPNLRQTISHNDYAERVPSAKAHAAINEANERENQ